MLFVLFVAVAVSCRCRAPDVYSSSKFNPDAVVVNLPGSGVYSDPSKGILFVKGVITSVFNGCSTPGMSIKVATSNSSASCGASLPSVSGSFLFFGSFVNTSSTLYVTSCSFFASNTTLTPAEWSYLYSTRNDCTGKCAVGVSVAHCFVEPCHVSSCAVDDAVCEDSYCGGCFAYWFTPNNTRVCFNDAARSCVRSGGVVTTKSCCASVGDFPNSCSIGACSCSPTNSKPVQVCQCPPGSCFDGSACQ